MFDKVKDSGVRQEFETGSRRDTQKGKGRFDLIPTYPMRRLARHYENGAAKYGDRNWEKGQPLMRYLDSAERHMNMLKSGDTSEDHAAAVAWNIFGYMHTLAMIEAGQLPKSLDNRPTNIDPEYGVFPDLGQPEGDGPVTRATPPFEPCPDVRCGHLDCIEERNERAFTPLRQARRTA